MSYTEPDWSAIVVAALRVDYPKLPATLPAVVASLVPVWAERVSGMDPSVRQEQLGAYSVTYSGGGSSAWLTPVEETLLKPYRYAHHGSPVTPGPSSEAAVDYLRLSEDEDYYWWL